MNGDLQSGIEKAEGSMPPPAEPGAGKKKVPVKRYLSYALIPVFIAILIRLVIISSAPVEPVYEVQIPDSSSITSSIRIIEDYVRSEGTFPPNFQDRVSSNPDLSLEVNNDSSFTYIEAGVVYRSAPGILLHGGDTDE